LAHAGEEDLDICARSECGFEGSGFSFNGEADEGEGRFGHSKVSVSAAKERKERKEKNIFPVCVFCVLLPQNIS